ncbi:MAG: hypothetical protein ACD_79C00202G0002 [uncultured bacterium]|nr:MAG: hypothetical protein ACD_79C00202G0002 [uncultured bacterium]
MNNYTESKKYFKEALKIKDITTYFRWKTLFYLSSICKSENKKNNVYTKLEERELKKKKNKSDGLYTREASEMIYRMGSIYKLNKNYKKARAAFELLLNESSNMDIIDGVCFHLGEICFILNNFVAAKQYFKQCLKHNPEHNKALELLNRC